MSGHVTFDDMPSLVTAMNAVADDYESDMLEALLVRCGYFWMCERSWVNVYDEPTCGECGRTRTECEAP